MHEREPVKNVTGLTEGQRAAAIRLTKKLAAQIVERFPQIADEYRADRYTLVTDLAQKYLSGEFAINAEITSNALGKALQTLIPPEEYKSLLSDHRQAYHERLREEGHYKSDKHRDMSRKGIQRRLSSGMDQSSFIQTYNLSKGRVPWHEEEREVALALSDNPEYRHKTGNVKRYPDYPRIAEELNHKYHKGKKVRTAASVSVNVRDWKLKEKKQISNNL